MLAEDKGIVNVVGVRFMLAGRVQWFDPGTEDLDVDDRVEVETESGPREGVVAIAPRQVLFSQLRGPLAPLLRKLDTSEGE
jgi:cell fate regulator YaaT (PSP1 superfamily)